MRLLALLSLLGVPVGFVTMGVTAAWGGGDPTLGAVMVMGGLVGAMLCVVLAAIGDQISR